MSREDLVRELAEVRGRVARLEAERLFSSLEALAVLADGLGLGFFAKEPDTGAITVFNREMAGLAGLDAERAPGLGEEEVLGRRTAALGRPSELASLGSGAPVCAEEHIAGPEGAAFVRTVRWAVRDVNGETAALVCLVQDLTGHKQLIEDHRAMARNMLDIYYRTDAEGRLRFVTPSGARLLGYDDPAQMLGKDVAEAFYAVPEERARFLGRLMQRDRVENAEVELKTRGGRTVPVEVNSRVVRDGDGNVVSVEGVLRDISKRRSMEGLYRVSERYYRQLFDNTGTAMAIFGEDAVIKRCNGRFEDLAGLPRKEIEGIRTMFDFVDSLDQPRMHDFHRRRFQKGPHAPPTRYQFKFAAAGGRTRDVLANIAVIPESRERIFSLIDVTELKELERALFEVAERLREAQEISGVGSWEHNLDTGKAFWSDQTYLALGYKPGECRPTLEAFLDRVHPDDRGKVLEIQKIAVEEGRVEGYEFRVLLPDGEQRWSRIKLKADRNPAGQWRLLGLGMDVTEQKLREKQLIRARRRAEDANRAKTEFLANVSHEIRTPANVITSMLKLLSMGNLSAEHMEYVQSANMAVGGLVNLLNDLLDLSRIEAGALEIKEAPFVFATLFEQVSDSFGEDARSRGAELDCRVEGDFPRSIVSDEGRIRQILLNLVGNAVKHTRRGGVEVRARVVPSGEDGRGELAVVVRDTGSGIDSEDLARVFQPFARGAVDDSIKGAGLGLSIVRKLSRLMGGDVSIESEPGRGTTARVRLLVGLPDEEERVPDDAERSGEAPVRPLRILVVEDDVVSREGLVRFLELHGHATDAAGEGREALDKLDAGDFDLVLMDVRMPGMDGMEAVQRIRAGEAGADKAEIPVVALTAQAMKGDRDRLVAAGMSEYLPKPLDYDRLLDLLSKTS